jgi:uncharacterized protein (DUF433 family)
MYQRRVDKHKAATDRHDKDSGMKDRIEIDPTVMLGKPVIRGTRIPVELVVRKYSEGATEAQLQEAYPQLTVADLRAALAFAADSLAHEELIVLDGSATAKRE